ncbi:hypothetical protein [Aureimonas altamirensis]|uniref:hypothetical protein n=1 Tax=Aureimonas altamirensis TaxID=370622 RepID=UPI003019543D
MGMTPTQVGELSFWQFQAAAEGFRRAHMTEEQRAQEPFSKDDLEYVSNLIKL